MKIVTTTASFPAGYDVIKAVDRLANVGFSTLDMAFDYCTTENSPFMGDQWEDWIYRLRDRAESRGVEFTHSHASFNASERGPIVERTMRCAQILGCRYMVVHGEWFAPDGRVYEESEEFLDVNTELYKPLVEAAKAHSLVILTENGENPAIYSELTERVNSSNFGWCYDTGHAHMKGSRPSALIGIAHPPASLHVQDNHGEQDEHILPGDGTIDWEEFLQTLATIHYAGEFVLEAHRPTVVAPDEQREAILQDLLNRAKKMVARLEEIRGY